MDKRIPASLLPDPTANGLFVEGAMKPGDGNPAGAHGASAAGGDLSTRDLVALLSHALLVIRSKWLWGIAAALVVGGLSAWALLHRPVEHQAQTVMLAQGALDKVVGTRGEDAVDSQVRENMLRNHLSGMNSRKFRVRLVNSFSAEERAQIAQPYLSPGETVTDGFIEALFESKIRVERERGREFFTIVVSHEDPEVAVMIADRFTAQYLSLIQSEFREANRTGFDLLLKQIEATRKEIASVEEARLDFRKEHKIISRADNQGLLAERLKRLDGSLTDTRVRRVQLETQVGQARADRARTEYPWDNAYLATYANNPALRQELDRNFAQRAVLATRYGPRHPKLRDMDAAIKGVQENILRNFDLALRDLESQLDAATQTEQQLQKEFNDAFESSIEIEKLASRYEIIGTDTEELRHSLTQLQKKLSEANLSSQLPTDFMQVVDPAFIVEPAVPPKVIHVFVIALLTLGAFLTAPLLANLFDERIKSTTDLEAALGKPLVGAVPFLKMREEERPHVVHARPDIAFSEPFMSVTAQLEINSHASYPKCIVVTSTLPGEGKSTVASNLATSYARMDRKVIIVDLDLRRPSQHRLHGVSAGAGFLVWARAGFPHARLLEPTGALGLRTLPNGVDLIASGGDDPQPTHHLISRSLTELLNVLRECYDVVIVDTPPAGLFQDAALLARLATERLLVAREARAPIAQVKRVITEFEKAQAPITGIIINAFHPGAAHPNLAYARRDKKYGYYRQRPVADAAVARAGRGN